MLAYAFPVQPQPTRGPLQEASLGSVSGPSEAGVLQLPLLDKQTRVMAVFAHPDDEIACVGSLSSVVRMGGAARLVWLTRGELASQFGDTAPQEVARIREEQGALVADLMGAEYSFMNFPDSGLTGGREEALALARLIAKWKPQRILTWHPFDVHPDHRATYWAVLSALKLCRIPKLVGTPYREEVRLYHYVSPDLPRPTLSVNVAQEMEVIEAVYGFYHDTFGWSWTLDDLRRCRARMGRRAGFSYAEQFQEASLAAVEGLPA